MSINFFTIYIPFVDMDMLSDPRALWTVHVNDPTKSAALSLWRMFSYTALLLSTII